MFLKFFLVSDFSGKLILLLLFFSSIYTWAIIVRKTLLFITCYRFSAIFKNYVYKMPKPNKLIVDEPTMYSALHYELLELHMRGGVDSEQAALIAERIFAEWEMKLEKDLDYLAVIGSVSPFVGLLGTVLGIMNSFQSIANSNTSNIAVVAPGISEALFATAVGLCVAIPAVIATNIFYSKIEFFSKDLTIFSNFMVKSLNDR